MPIAAQCGACAARYKIVDTAAGRRVRCRRCGKPLQVPGGAPVERRIDLHALADLERKGTIIETPDSAMEQYQSALATLSGGTPSKAVAAKKEMGRSYAELAVGADGRKMARNKEARRSANASAVADGMPLPLVAILVIGGVCVLLVVLGFFSRNIAFLSLIILGGGAVLFTIWAALEARAVLIEEDILVRLLWRFMPFYRAYFLIVRWRDMLRSMILHCIGAGMAVLAVIAYVLAAPKIHQLLYPEDSQTASAVQPGQPPQLNDMGEVDNPNAKPPPGWPKGKPWVEHRVVAPTPRALYIVTTGASIDYRLTAPPGWKEELQKLVHDKVTEGGLRDVKNAKITITANVVANDPQIMKFEEVDGAYTPSEKGTVTARVAHITCQIAYTAAARDVEHTEQNLPDLTWPIKPAPGQDLQTAIFEAQFKAAMEAFKAMKYPDKKMWDKHDIGF